MKNFAAHAPTPRTPDQTVQSSGGSQGAGMKMRRLARQHRDDMAGRYQLGRFFAFLCFGGPALSNFGLPGFF
ncbi:hypothetical protein, partial [Mesorhizobium sp. BR1-1-7]|uniref:hypothetical protein n=1 Tax=Mesorhizobium sp. BR1-1-7 TaxID=2876647 RepID=UPI001CCCF0CE